MCVKTTVWGFSWVLAGIFSQQRPAGGAGARWCLGMAAVPAVAVAVHPAGVNLSSNRRGAGAEGGDSQGCWCHTAPGLWELGWLMAQAAGALPEGPIQ